MTNRAESFRKWATIRSQYPFCQETIMQAEILLTLK
ncbi:molybdenum-dependent transcriptional regulator, partial [Klebsiella pneumoniae]